MSDNGQALVVRQPTELAPTVPPEKMQLVKKLLFPDSTDLELEFFITVCNRLELDPFAKQIYVVKRWDRRSGENKMVIMPSVDGYRLNSARTGLYLGTTDPQWCGADGVWKDVWLSDEPPAAARVGVYRKGNPNPIYGVCTYKEFCQKYKDKQTGRMIVSGMWEDMPANQLAVAAERQAHRKGFPERNAGLEEEVKDNTTEATSPARLREIGRAFNDFNGEEPKQIAPAEDIVDGEVVEQPAEKIGCQACGKVGEPVQQVNRETGELPLECPEPAWKSKVADYMVALDGAGNVGEASRIINDILADKDLPKVEKQRLSAYYNGRLRQFERQ